MKCVGVELGGSGGAEIRAEVERLDVRLASLAREETALRLRLGQALAVMGRGAVFELGFSSLAAYAVERCERSARWAEGARCLASRVEKLPELRRAIALGLVSWTMGELLARIAQPEDEVRWLEVAECRTVRQMRALVAEATSSARQAHAEIFAAHVAGVGGRASRAAESGISLHADDDAAYCECFGDCSEMCTLTFTVDQEDAWLFEATRSLLEQLGVRGADAQIEALLAEARGTLLDEDPDVDLDLERLLEFDGARQQWLSELRRWRGDAELRCERAFMGYLLEGRARVRCSAATSVTIAAALGMSALEHASSSALDQLVRKLYEAMARHELELSRLVLRFHRSNGWRRLGYATETQYARERLGMSASSLLARRSLALRLEKLPVAAAALGRGQIGVEAALQLVRVATPNTESVWVKRARTRTIKHLKEEVAAALTAVRWSGEIDCLPPIDAEMVSFQALEQAVVSGRVQSLLAKVGRAPLSADRSKLLAPPVSEQRRAWFVMLASLASWLAGGLQMSAHQEAAVSRKTRRAGRVTLRLRMSRVTRAWWHALEARVRGRLPSGISWLRFACSALWSAWRHLFGADVAYGHIYVRDRYRCTSPVCNRRDVTPHHLRFRSEGGNDAEANVASVCTWCHLLGVHGGRIRARGTAELIHWELGAKSSPCLVVHGREREVA